MTVTPSTGVAPTTVRLDLNPQIVPYLRAGVYALYISFQPVGQGGNGGTATYVVLTIYEGAPPAVSAVLNAATFQPAISPGTVVSIFGSHLSTPPQSGQPDVNSFYPTTLGNSEVVFSAAQGRSYSAPMLFVSTGQINTVVSFETAGLGSAPFGVGHGFQSSPDATVTLQDTAPGIFTATMTGAGEGAILNADCANPNLVVQNDSAHPAPKGCAITLFATGAGVWTPSLQDGRIVTVPDLYNPPRPVAPVSLSIGGKPAQILYAGAAPGLVAGILQVNAIVPDGIASGSEPVILSIGAHDNAPQLVTMFVQ